MAICDLKYELKTNIGEYKDLLEKAERQIRELKLTIEKIIDSKLTAELIPMDTIRAKITQFLSDGVIEDGRDSYQERADTLLSFELEPKITLKDIIGFYYHNVTEENT